MTNGSAMPQQKLQAYTDGQCPLCRWTRAKVEPYDRDQRIQWLDYNDPDVLQRAAPFTRGQLAAEMHVCSADGRWSKGYHAWMEVLRVLPRWRWLSTILSRWPFAWVGSLGYRWLASHRYTLFGVPPPCDEDGVCRLHIASR